MSRHALTGPAAVVALALLGSALPACLPLPPIGMVVVQVGPPAPRWERMGPPPGPGFVWVGGYWVWRTEGYTWVAGSWTAIPPGHRYWVPGHWIHSRRGWYFVEGYWD